MTSKRPAIGTIAAIVLAVVVAVGAISASAGNERAGDSASPKLVGSWMQTVDRVRRCPR